MTHLSTKINIHAETLEQFSEEMKLNTHILDNISTKINTQQREIHQLKGIEINAEMLEDISRKIDPLEKEIAQLKEGIILVKLISKIV